MYVCGITPYDATHLGHAFTYLAYDLAYRAFLDAGYRVRYVQNVTDIDDPLLERAERDGVGWRDLATREVDRFRRDMTELRVLPPTHYVGVVEAIPTVVAMLTALYDRGMTYAVDSDLYFSVVSHPRFGSIARLSRDAMIALSASHGGDPDRIGKKDPLDPLLWRARRPGEPAWPSPFGPGRPGWHVECSAIARAYLGESIDVQGGGSDLLFPHHEYGAALAEAAGAGVPFAGAYLHTAMVGLDGHKMSKSRGNLELVSRLRAAGADPMALRLALLAHHHRADWEWTPEALAGAAARLARWRAAASAPRGPDARPLLARVRRHLADDLDAPAALAAMDSWAAEAAAAGTGPQADPGAPRLFGRVADALLGVDLGVGPEVDPGTEPGAGGHHDVEPARAGGM
jgi:L-cysteine:1D-myo-inositol 2-amino-2-deoxy-alpha-D-glucopyranoside ligase